MKVGVEETEALELTSYFQSLYKKFHLRKNERKQVQRREKLHGPKSRHRNKTLLMCPWTGGGMPLELPRMEVLGNCSPFSAFASIRELVLELSFAEESKKWLVSSEERDNECDNAGPSPDPAPSPVPLPRVVGIGLETVFQLLKESQVHGRHTTFCVKALQALLQVLGGQHPQSLRKEPSPVIDALFSTLLSLSREEVLAGSDVESPAPSSRVRRRGSSGGKGEQITALATASLISLAVARGETKMLLEAVSSLFISNPKLSCQIFECPDILRALQRSTHAILVGRPNLPQWLSHGIPNNSCVDSFTVNFPPDPPGSVFTAKSLATDGRYLFLHCSRGLYKIGSGSFATERGRIYASDPNFHLTEKVWLGWASGKLFYRVLSGSGFETVLRVLNEETLDVRETVRCGEEGSLTMFSDGVHLGAIFPSKEDGFVARTVWMDSAHVAWDSFLDLNLRLVKRSLEACGPCPWDNETCPRSITTGLDEEVGTVCAGKDFALLRTQHGRILYCGKGASLGQKSGLTKCSKWLDLGMTKWPRFLQCAVGHDGIHALLLGDDGTAYFVGTPKRGEDGDQAKPRRVAKASKPKKVIRMEGYDVTYVACNNGTSAFVTRAGDLFLFGKDTAHCEPSTGCVTALKGVFISQVAMGKAHSVLLSGDGKVYTMGINNRGQCGRSWKEGGGGGGVVGGEVIEEDEGEWEEGGAGGGALAGVGEPEGICPPGSHRWKHEQCMICTVCRECTGYGSACISALRPDRNPGQECGCGVGDAGCAECGSCRSCAREGIEDQDYVIIEAQRVLDPVAGELLQLEEVVSERVVALEEKRVSKGSSKSRSRGKESSMTSFPPSRLHLPTPYPINQVACGLHHSVFLDSNGSVFVCGSNSFGQLGMGDLSPRHNPCKLRFPGLDPEVKIKQIGAGSYHTVALDSNGVVYTCGSHTKGQLAREPDENKTDPFWFAKMLPLPNIGAKHGRRATWINASGDSTFMKLEVSLISPKMLQKSTVTANLSSIMIIPPLNATKSASVIMINRKDGCCSYFDPERWRNSVSLATSAAVLDPVYDFLWTFEWRRGLMRCHSVISSAVRNPEVESNLWLTKPPYAVPSWPGAKIERWQAGASLLACLDSLVGAQGQGLTVSPAEEGPALAALLSKMYSREDYSAVSRFESHGGGWGYSGHSVEAIRFSSDGDLVVGGLGLFGGRGEYSGKAKLFDLGPEGGENEGEGELLAETEEVPYECGPRQKFRLMFEEPVAIQAGRWYVAWAHITGPSSDCGSSGQSLVVTEDQVTFQFKSSKKSNNGTDVNAGQIPQILYRLMTPDQSSIGTKQKPQAEPTYLISNDFVSSFSHTSILTLMRLVTWCWEEIKALASSGEINVFKAELMQFVTSCSLRLTEFGVNQAYPQKGCSRLSQSESSCMAEAVGELRSTIQYMMSCKIESTDPTIRDAVEKVMNQTCKTFVNCFQIFYPTPILKWECLSHFLHLYFKEASKYARILSAILEALCRCRGHLLGVFPILNSIAPSQFEGSSHFSLHKAFVSESGNAPSRNQVLITQMASRNDVEGFTKSDWTFWEVLDNLLVIVNQDDGKVGGEVKPLVQNSSVLLARLMEELVSHASGTFAELESVMGQLVLLSPSRFTRTNQSRTWNTGNGSPDAVCFTTDQSGVTVFGACIYSGTGNYEYELDLLQEADDPGEPCDQQNAKWTTLESARGTFESDESYADVVEIKFPRPVNVKPGLKYSIRLKNHGARTCNGDGGITVLRCPDGTVFTFSSSSLSFNGTNQIRGQIPHILYFRNPEDSESRLKAKALSEMQARQCAQKMSNSIFESAKTVFLKTQAQSSNRGVKAIAKSALVTTLLPSILAHLPRLAVSNLRSCVELLEQVKEILPSVSDLNNKLTPLEESGGADGLVSNVHFSWVESEHPYRPATVSHFRVNFPSTVQIMSIEFDPRCSTAQPEDSLRLYLPKGLPDVAHPFPAKPVTPTNNSGDQSSEEGNEPQLNFIPILERYSGKENWPKKAVILPGNEVLFSLETASDYNRAEKDHYFGFRCLVSGFEVNTHWGLGRLEVEMAYLGGICAFELVKKDLVLPPVSAEEVTAARENQTVPEEEMMRICSKHQQLFTKGIGLEYFPDVKEALDGIVPLRERSKEREFIANFVARTPNTSGERLANWIQPEPFVDPQKCEVITPQESVRRGVPTYFTILTRDQYGDLVLAQNLHVEVKALPTSALGQGSEVGGSRPTSFCYPKEFYAHIRTGLEGLVGASMIPYQVTLKDKMRYHSITMMKEYENVSFEELRVLSPQTFRSSESMLVRQCSSGNYTATWTPSCAGSYRIRVSLDGYPIPEGCQVEVEESMEKPYVSRKSLEEEGEGPAQQLLKKRKFKTPNSAGLRIRAHPSLQSEQIGVVPVNGVIEFTEEVQNEDGIWVKLEESSLYSYCEGNAFHTRNFRVEGWCLQFNQHVGRTLLFPITPPKRLNNDKNLGLRKPSEGSLSAYMDSSKILRLNGSPGSYQVVKCGVSGHNVRSRPCLRSPPVGILVMGSRFTVIDECFNNEGLWVKLDAASQRKFCFTSEGDAWSLAVGQGDVVYLRQLESGSNEKGYDFSLAAQHPQSIFQNVSPPAAFVNPAFPDSILPPDLKDPEVGPQILPPSTVSEKSDSRKNSADLESISTSSMSEKSPSSRRGSESEPQKPVPKPKTSTPLGTLQKWLQLGTSSESRHSSSGGKGMMEVSRSLVKERIGVFGGGERQKPPPPPVTTNSATQTSPQEQPVPHFNLGPPPAPTAQEKILPLSSGPQPNKKKGRASARGIRRLRSPPLHPHHPPLPVPTKRGMGPGEAEALRAVFGAILSHGRIVHDAMACAAYLRFAKEPDSPFPVSVVEREEPASVGGGDVVLRRRDKGSPGRKKSWRHSLEVTAPSKYWKEGTLRLPPLHSVEGLESKAEEEDHAPLAMTALAQVWKHVKDSCSDLMIKDSSPTRFTQLNQLPGGPSRSVLDGERMDEEEERRCELCMTTCRSKGRSKKAHFGLSSLCDNCSERQLRLQRSRKSPPQVPGSKGKGRGEGLPHSSLLENSLFLLQMTNGAPPESRKSPLAQTPPRPFSCFRALGLSDSHVVEDEDPFPDLKSPVLLRDFGDSLRERRLGTSFTVDDETGDWMERRRKGSNGGEGMEESATALLNFPSVPLQRLFQLPQTSVAPTPDGEAIRKMCLGVLAFVTERHELGALKLFLFQTIRKLTCRAYGMQMIAWLLRNVSQPTALHDILWWYASSLELKAEDPASVAVAGLDNGWWQMRLHPLAEPSCSIFPQFSESFYTLMQTIADLMSFLPVGSPILEMAVKCWGVCFSRHDHKFLHKSKIFRNLSKIMSQFDGDLEWSKNSTLQMETSDTQYALQGTISLHDLTAAMEVKVSSRVALCSSLTDESTETFWESGDEDRNRTKCLTVLCTCEAIISVVAVHVDNGRDTQCKVSSISVKVGTHPDECVKVGHIELDSKHCGWSWFSVTQDNVKVVKIDLKGPDNTLRVRQIKVLGTVIGDPSIMEKGIERNFEMTPIIAQRKCENETLRIFRLLSSEVFGKFLYGMRRGESDGDGNDLQEHVVGILFSRNKLTHLQKQVCSHIVSAIHREAVKIREEMETQIVGSVLEAGNENIRLINPEKPRVPDRYCFEMLTLVLALADHKVGRSYLSQQSNLIQDIMQLFHSGTPRIQRQVVAVVRKILPEMSPESFQTILNQPLGEEERLGVLDMFFGSILKALQVKVRGSQDGNRSAKNISITDILILEELPAHYWFFRGEGDLQLAISVVSLVKDLCDESFSPLWAPVAKKAISEAVLYLTRIEGQCRRAAECLNSPKFWLSLAALSTLHPDHSKLLSSPVFLNGSAGRTKCVNHDDGETLAVLQCHDCGDLCTECDRILHLPKRKWPHVRKVCKEEEESIKVDLHEGCGRIKLFWLMALVDSSTLKALVEFRNGVPKPAQDSGSAVSTVGRCRFCDKVGNTGPLALGNVCGEPECQEYAKIACDRVLECSHLCGGVRNETKCLPCLQGCSDKLGTILKQDGDDMCMICFTDALAFAPAIQLSCGHVFHFHCCRSILENRWAGPRITFAFSLCPICKVEMNHELLEEVLHPIRELYEDVRRKALMRLEYEGLNQADEIITPGGRYHQDAAGFAMDRYAYYVCYKCKKPYFGGEARCDVELQLEFDPTELLCGGCSDVSQAQLCPKHGTDYLEYKCRYCCSVAVFFCFGTTHFCNGCHDDFQRITAIAKHQLPHCPAGPRARQLEGEECPLHVSHPPTGEEFALGCGICRNAHTF